MGQMKASTERHWASRRRSSSARNRDAVVPRGSIDPNGMSCLIELVLRSTLYDIRHILVPSARRLDRGMTKARVSGRIAIERDPEGESTKVYPWSHSCGSEVRSLGHPDSPCQRMGLLNSSTGAVMPIAGTEIPLATVARSGDTVVGKFDKVSVVAMCSEAAESRMDSNFISCPEDVLNTMQSSDRDFSFCATDSHKPNTEDMPFLKSSGAMSRRF